MNPQKAVVIAVKKSEWKKNTYYVTVRDRFGELKVLADRKYEIGDEVLVAKKNPVDNIWVIVKE